MITSSDFDKQQLNVNTDFAGVVGDNTHIEGDIAFYQDSDKDAFIEENLDDVRNDEFIAPTHSQDIVDRVLSNRFLLLLGKDRMGKAALARHIADMLLQENSDELPVKKIRQSFDLNEVLEYLISEKTQDYIVLGYDINIKEIQKNIDTLIRIARQKSKFVIFTSELSSSLPSNLQEFSVEVQINYPYTPQNIEKLLEQYFQGHEIELNVELKKNIHNISKRLVSPSVAVRLAESLPKESALPAYNEWVERLNDLKEFHKEVKHWLSNLGKDECILFLTLALFHDLPDHNFWMVYEAVIDELKKRDPTLIKLDYYALEENREFIASEHRIAFRHIEDRESILLRLLKLYRRSLLTILPFLDKQIYEFLYKKDMRLAMAEAVGYIGTVEEKDANDILYNWAKHKNPSVRAAVGHAHRQMIKVAGDKALLRILNETPRYLDENNNVERKGELIETWGPRWTVASSLGRINNYVSEDRFEKDILPILKKVCKDKHIAVRIAAIYSMRKIGLTRFKQIRPILAKKAKDHRVEVQLELAETLASLSMSNKSDIHQLLQEWLVGQDEDRLWTAFYTFYLLDSQEDGQLNMLQQQILENFNLQSRIINKLNEMLTSKNISNEKIIDLFDSIARRNDISMNTILLVQILAEN
ncbi:HEAT repeat domain-containing protein, partial [Desulfobulbus sp. TB]|nr:HEAT repeat domain-containing protein [Desulfobulbus sp. TB]